MSCNPKYIDNLQVSDKAKEDLRQEHRDIFDKLREAQTLNKKGLLFRKKLTEGEAHYLLPEAGDPNRKKALELIKDINSHYDAKVVGTAVTKGNDEYVFVNVKSLPAAHDKSAAMAALHGNTTTGGASPLFQSTSTQLSGHVITTIGEGSASSSTTGTPSGHSTITSHPDLFRFTHDIEKKYPQAGPILDAIGTKIEMVEPEHLVKDGVRIQAGYDSWEDKIRITKDAKPGTFMHELLHAVMFKAAEVKTEEKFAKTTFGRALTKFTDSLRSADADMPDNDQVDKILVAASKGSVQEIAAYGLFNFTFAMALNEAPSKAQKVPVSMYEDLAKTTLRGKEVRSNSKLAELINLLDKHTTGSADIAAPDNVDPEMAKVVDRKFNNLNEVGAGVKLVRDKHGGITFENKGEKVRWDAGDAKAGFQTTPSREVEMSIRDVIKSTLDRLIDKEGHRVMEPEVENDKANDLLPSAMRTLIENVLSDRIKEYPVGTRFIHDKTIFSEAWNKAGQVDFIALKPNGKADIFSFDIISNKQHGKVGDSYKTDVKMNHQGLIRDHLNQLIGILKTSYDIKDFDQMRSVPMFVDLRKSDPKTKKLIPQNMAWDGANSGEVRRQIDEIPVWSELTGDKNLDQLIKKLVLLHEIKDSDAYTQENSKAKQNLARAIRNIQLGKGVLTLASIIEGAANSATFTVDDFKKNMRYKDVDKLTLADMGTQTRRLNKTSRDLELYSRLYSYYSEVFPDPSEQEKKNLKRLLDVCQKADESLRKLNDVRKEFIQDKIAQKYGVEQLLKAEPRVGIGAEYTNTFSNPTTRAQYVFQRMLRNTRSSYEVDIQEDLGKLNGIYKDLQEWMKGRSNSDLLDMIKRKDEHGNRKNELVAEFNKDWYTEARQMANDASSPDEETQKKVVAWFKANTDQEALKKWALKRYGQEILRIESKFPTDSNAYANAIENAGKIYDVDRHYLYRRYNEVRAFPKRDLWVSEEYKKLSAPGNEAVFALYNFAREVNKRAADAGYIEAEKQGRFLPFMHKTLAERALLGGKWSLMDSVLEGLTVSRVDTDYGAWDRLSNEPIDHLVKYFTNDFGTERKDENGKRYIDHSNVSDDIVKNLALYAGKVREYVGKSEIEEMTKLLLWAEKNKDSLQTNQFGNVVQDAEPFTNNEDNFKLLRDFVQNQLYDQHLVKNKYVDAASNKINEGINGVATRINKMMGRELIPMREEERRFSLVKTLQAAQALQNLKVLGFNIGASTYRFIGTNVQGLIEAGEHYSHKEFLKHELDHASLHYFNNDAELHLALMKTFWPVDSQKKLEMEKLSLSKFIAAPLSDYMMRMIEHAHDYIQYINFGAMMDNAVVINGEIKNARKYVKEQTGKARYAADKAGRKEIEARFEEDVKKLVEDHGLVKRCKMEDGKLTIDGVNLKSETVAIFKDLVRNTGRKLSGNISPENETKLRMTVLGRQLLMFKNWLPGMAHTRFVGLSHNEGLQDYEWGRIRMCSKLVFKYFHKSIGNMISMYKATEKGVGLMTALYEEKKSEFEKNHKQFNLSKEGFMDLMRSNLAKQAKEVTIMLGLCAVASMIAAAAHDHKDDPSRGAWAFGAKTMRRCFEEVNLYYNVMSLNAIINGSLFPTLGLLTDVGRFAGSFSEYAYGEATGDEKLVKKSHPLKYAMKTVPLFAQVPNYLLIVAPDIAQGLGVPVNAMHNK